MILMLLLQFLLLAFAITIHEIAHGWVAYKLGDSTAKNYGRLSFNPISHIDPIGTILLPLILINIGAPPLGWAKPVPVNFMNLRNPKKDMLWVGIAGPCANLLSAALIALIIKIPVLNNVIWLDRALTSMIYINLFLAVFNFIPIPPLDGSRIVTSLIPWRYVSIYNRIEPFGIIIIFILLWTGALRVIVSPVVSKLAMLLQVNHSNFFK